jgi:hypothetical protein
MSIIFTIATSDSDKRHNPLTSHPSKSSVDIALRSLVKWIVFDFVSLKEKFPKVVMVVT